jgi:putative membrane protein
LGWRRWLVLGRRRVGGLVLKIDEFFDVAARARVAEAVKAAEARTTGQIVPVVVARSGHLYWLWNYFFYVVCFYFARLIFAELQERVPFFARNLPWGRAPLQMLVWAAVTAAAVVVVLTAISSKKSPDSPFFEAAVRRRALRAFREHGVHETREQNGVLLFASLYERKVVVLGDRAVHEKLGDEHWKRAVDTLVAGIKAGDPASGFCAAIADIGEEMAKAFPRGEGSQPNEISDELRLDR